MRLQSPCLTIHSLRLAPFSYVACACPIERIPSRPREHRRQDDHQQGNHVHGPVSHARYGYGAVMTDYRLYFRGATILPEQRHDAILSSDGGARELAVKMLAEQTPIHARWRRRM
jgi:hypothetical protein